MNFKEWIQLRESKGIITFDFDDTLTLPFWDKENELWSSSSEKPHEENINKLKKHASEGYKIHIVTSRFERDKPEVVRFVKHNRLPVVDVIATGGPKGKALFNLNSLMHYDDTSKTFEDPENLFKGKWVKIFHPFDN